MNHHQAITRHMPGNKSAIQGMGGRSLRHRRSRTWFYKWSPNSISVNTRWALVPASLVNEHHPFKRINYFFKWQNHKWMRPKGFRVGAKIDFEIMLRLLTAHLRLIPGCWTSATTENLKVSVTSVATLTGEIKEMGADLIRLCVPQIDSE